MCALIWFSVNGNIEGVQRLEEEERERAKEAAAGSEQEPLEGDRDPTMTGQQRRALTILRRLAFGMNRCVAKSNGEMAYQMLFEQEQLVTYRGYNMFFRYVPYAIMRCRHEDMEEVLQARPHLNGSPLDVLPDPEGEAPVVVDEFAEVVDEGGDVPRVQQVHVNFNQKDDYLHRGSSVLLQCMSLLMYSRFVRRVSRNKAGKVDGVKFFDFDEHYAHFSSSVQDCLRWVVLFFVLTLFGVFKFDIWKVLTSSGEVVYFCVELKFAGSESSR